MTVNGLLPGQFNTDRIESLISATAEREGRSSAGCAICSSSAIRQSGLARSKEFGFACAWMCSARSGYLTGQNILIDGGSFNSTL